MQVTTEPEDRFLSFAPYFTVKLLMGLKPTMRLFKGLELRNFR